MSDVMGEVNPLADLPPEANAVIIGAILGYVMAEVVIRAHFGRYIPTGRVDEWLDNPRNRNVLRLVGTIAGGVVFLVGFLSNPAN